MISPEEHRLISGYAKAELIGGLMLGDFARRATDPDMQVQLTHHASQEVGHGLYWYEALEKLGLKPVIFHDSDKRHYYGRAGRPTTEVEMLAFTEALEPIAYQFYQAYAATDGVDPIIKETIERILKEEDEHQDWLPEWLNAYHDQELVKQLRDRYATIVGEVYTEELARLKSLGGLLAQVAENAQKSPRE